MVFKMKSAPIKPVRTKKKEYMEVGVYDIDNISYLNDIHNWRKRWDDGAYSPDISGSLEDYLKTAHIETLGDGYDGIDSLGILVPLIEIKSHYDKRMKAYNERLKVYQEWRKDNFEEIKKIEDKKKKDVLIKKLVKINKLKKERDDLQKSIDELIK